MVIDTNKALGVVTFLTDIYILCVPLAAVSTLQLSAKNRIGVIFVLMTGVMYVYILFQERNKTRQSNSHHRKAPVRWVWQALYFDSGPMDRRQIDSTYLLAGTLIVT